MSGYSQLVFGLIGALVLVYIGYAIADWRRERKRRWAFQRLARKLGLQYVARDDDIPRQYRFLDALRQGRGNQLYAFNVLHGRYEGYFVRAFDYHCNPPRPDSKGMSETDIYSISFFLLQQDTSFPEVLIHPKGRLTTLGQAVKVPKVDFESVEFSRAFVVRSRDRKFAYDVCHPRMMEYLLEHRDLSLEIEGRCIAMSFPRRLKPEEIPGRLDQLVEIRQLFPEYLYRD